MITPDIDVLQSSRYLILGQEDLLEDYRTQRYGADIDVNEAEQSDEDWEVEAFDRAYAIA